jgi:hypothetical protein
MGRHRTHSIEFKRQVAQEFLGGEAPLSLASTTRAVALCQRLGCAIKKAKPVNSDRNSHWR